MDLERSKQTILTTCLMTAQQLHRYRERLTLDQIDHFDDRACAHPIEKQQGAPCAFSNPKSARQLR
jgi:hypothetical protein